MSSKKTKSSGNCGSAPKGDREAGLNPPIPFVPPKADDDEKEPPTVEITILKDPSKPATYLITEQCHVPHNTCQPTKKYLLQSGHHLNSLSAHAWYNVHIALEIIAPSVCNHLKI